ncbi:restriction endonuclease [Youngiibacter fragilis]|uniref:Restriction endonuclease n=1 Tax=Youngiibacter fragilis 232.1 TaxID=994573 RepID=V7I6E2_9CLOT|nr:restriction endonuclease [Youngiibacter fragilis]ETA80562.1 hypothetical protein T472_0210895 [Youngiibacter fragilis 232.1]
MQNNSYNAKVPNEILEKFSNLLKMLDDESNTIPSIAKRSFNFKGRKSESIALKVLDYISSPDSKICDPFMGSGSFVFASSMLGRDTVGIELDNYTFDVLATLHSKIDYAKLESMFQEIKSDIFNDVMYLYETHCCNEVNYIKTLYFDPTSEEYYNPQPHREIIDGKNIKLYYKCPICGETSKRFSSEDEQKIYEVNSLDTSRFPDHELITNSRINITSSTGADRYDRNFSNRNKYALLLIQDKISSIPDCKEKDLLQHALVSALTLSKITQYGSSSDILYHVIRNKAQDMNVWYLFETKYNNMVAYNKHYCEQSPDKTTLLTYANMICGDYASVLRQPKFNQYFDVIYTDPPYTDQVPYLERNQLYRDWLFNFSDKIQYQLSEEMLDKEIVVTNAPTRREKDVVNYYKSIDTMFSLFSKAIKTNGIVALTLNLGKKKFFETFSNFIDLARKNGFEYIYRVDIAKNDPTLRKQSAWRDTLSTEMLIFFIKLDEEKAYWYKNNRNIELELGKLLYSQILKNNGITLTSAYKEISNKTLDKQVGDLTETETTRIRALITEQFIIDQRTSMVYVDPDKLYLSIEDNTTLFNKLYDIVPIIINNLLEKWGSFTLDDLYFEISSKVCNGDPNILAQILEDPSREKHIVNLIENYCNTDEKSSYTRKTRVSVSPTEDAIDISMLDGYRFEDVLKDLLTAEGFISVIRIGGAGDRGIDLRAKKTNPLTGELEGYIFQSKRWIGNVGGEPIQRLHSMMMQYSSEIQHAICITTSDYTEHGKREAKSTGVEIINGEDLIERLNISFPGKYYHGLLDFQKN